MFAYVGGKYRQADWIINQMEQHLNLSPLYFEYDKYA